jgi:hypothetical protein
MAAYWDVVQRVRTTHGYSPNPCWIADVKSSYGLGKQLLHVPATHCAEIAERHSEHLRNQTGPNVSDFNEGVLAVREELFTANWTPCSRNRIDRFKLHAGVARAGWLPDDSA